MINKIVKEVFEIEANQIAQLSNQLTSDFEKSIQAILSSKWKVIISGMGKSGIIGKKIAATLASTGTPSFFLHPGEAYHGDLGMIEKNDVVILISNSGETDEILKLIPFIKNQENITISMSGNPSSTLSKNSTFHLNIGVNKEVCPLQLAPTCSTTATLVMGDAIAVVLMKLRNFKDENFAKFHPGGSLGKRLLTKVKDVMKTTLLPTCSKNATIIDVVDEITKGMCGLTIVTENSKILGVISDGDIRRTMQNNKTSFFNLVAKDIMTMNPVTIDENEKLATAEEIMKTNKINSLIVCGEEHRLAGIVQLFDLT